MAPPSATPSPLPQHPQTSSNNPTSPNDQDHTHNSYTKMSIGDVEAIGAHCQAAFCHQLDFLPFRCESCRGSFCLDHRSETAHACSNAGAWARARSSAFNNSENPLLRNSSPSSRPNILNHESQCSETSCKTLVNTSLAPGIHCATCRRDYCLRHRMKEDHNCANLTPVGVGQQKDMKSLNDALGRLRAWGAAKKAASSSSTTGTTSSQQTKTSAPSLPSISSHSPALQRIISPFLTSARKSTTSSATAQTMVLNTLKRTAKGDIKIPSESRIYLHMEAVAASKEGSVHPKVPRADAFYGAEWTVGRVLDAAAKTLGVENVNNRGGGEETKLRVFHVEGGKLLAFSDKLGKEAGVKNGHTLVLLRGVGDPNA